MLTFTMMLNSYLHIMSAAKGEYHRLTSNVFPGYALSFGIFLADCLAFWLTNFHKET